MNFYIDWATLATVAIRSALALSTLSGLLVAWKLHADDDGVDPDGDTFTFALGMFLVSTVLLCLSFAL